jgi:outer membrane lipoprotein carrier protein
MTLRSLLAVGALTLWLAPGSAGAARPRDLPSDPEAPGLTPAERLQALVERVQWEQSRLASLEADFLQERTSEFLVKPEVSQGEFSYAAPDRVRWEYLEPRPISMVIHDNEMLTFYRDLGRAERMKVGKVSAQVFRYLDATGSLESLLDYFAVTLVTPAPGEPYRLELEPRYKRIAKRLKAMTLWIDRELYLPRRVRYIEPNGDSTEYRFERLRPNGAIPEARFELELPQGTPVRVVDLERGRVASD